MNFKEGTLKVVVKWIKHPGGTEDKVQELKVCEHFLWTTWRTIDEEVVPRWAWIEKATTGFTEWKSKFLEHGTFGSDGIITPRN